MLAAEKQLHEQGLAHGYGAVYLANALECKYPHANEKGTWQSDSDESRISAKKT